MNIALAQTQIVWEDKKKNIEKATALIEEQSGRGAELILFPEMSFTGFSMDTNVTKESGKETADQICSIAVRNQIAVGYGWTKDCGNTCENHYTIVDKKGEIVCDYAKIHPFSFSGEDKYFRGGNKTAVFRLNKINFSAFICYDLRFPELFQAISNNTSAIIVPANWPAERDEHWKTLLKARAIENQVYIFAVNCVGEMGGKTYYGNSCIINPDGRIERILFKTEGVICYDLRDDIEKFRGRFPMKKDRKISLYVKLYEKQFQNENASRKEIDEFTEN